MCKLLRTPSAFVVTFIILSMWIFAEQDVDLSLIMKIYVDDGAAIAFGILNDSAWAFELIAQRERLSAIISWLLSKINNPGVVTTRHLNQNSGTTIHAGFRGMRLRRLEQQAPH